MSIETFDRPLLNKRDGDLMMAFLAAMTGDKFCSHGRPKDLCAEHFCDLAAPEEDG